MTQHREPAPSASPDSQAAELLVLLSGSREYTSVAEGGLFHQAGIPTVVYGPGSRAINRMNSSARHNSMGVMQ